MNIEPIGIVRSCFKAKFGTPRQSQIAKHSQGYIEIESKWDPVKALRGLEGFSHAWVLFWFHDNKAQAYRPIVHPPRLGRKGVGALATRSPLRPNPIGLSLVKIERVAGARVYLSGIDIIDGTPVIDIKPYIKEYDSVSRSKSGWLEDVENQKLDVQFSAEALEALVASSDPNLRQNIVDILSSDIRNRNDKTIKNEDKALGFYFEDFNIVFKTSKTSVYVVKIERLSDLSIK